MGKIWDMNSGSWLGSLDIDAQLLVGAAPPNSQRVLRSSVPTNGGNFLCIAQTAYFVYMGRKALSSPAYRVNAYLNVLGVGAGAQEAGIFSTPLPPNTAGQTLTKIAATTTWDSLLVGLGSKLSGIFAPLAPVPAGTHLWAGVRFDLATTQPTFAGLLYDLMEGEILVTAAAAAFTTAGPWVGTVVPAQTGAAKVECAPDLILRTL